MGAHTPATSFAARLELPLGVPVATARRTLEDVGPACGDERVFQLSGGETCLAVVAVLNEDSGDASRSVPTGKSELRPTDQLRLLL
jgi:hypothetical protein